METYGHFGKQTRNQNIINNNQFPFIFGKQTHHFYRYASTPLRHVFRPTDPADPDRCPGAVPPGLLGREVRVEAGLVVVCHQKTGLTIDISTR